MKSLFSTVRGRGVVGVLVFAGATIGLWLFALSLLGGCASFDPSVLGQVVPGTGASDESTIMAGLAEALRVGTDRTVASTSRPGGFLENARIRIPLPESLQPVAKTLRDVGLDGPVDELETAMNRAAEQAAGQAAPVFGDAIRSLTWTDAKSILRGDDTAATTFFRGRTEGELRQRFEPIVARQLADVGAVAAYRRFADAYAALPLTTRPAFEPTDYVTGRALDGLFTVLGDEEKRIREDPLARTTELLRKVFGRS